MRKLEAEALLPYIHNCLRTEIDEKGRIHLSRFTQYQCRHVSSLREDFYEHRVALPAGITLDFHTDASCLELSWSVVKDDPFERDCIMDLYVDGVMVNSFTFPYPQPSARTLRAELPAGMKRVTLWLSRTADIAIKALSVPENAVMQPVAKGKKYLALGDSITYSSADHPSMGYAMQVARHFGWELYNQGLGGYYYDADSLDPELPVAPDVITVAYGTNDRRDDPQAYQERVSKYLARLISIWPDVPVFVIMPLWRLDISGTEAFERIYPIIRAECEKYPQITVIDGRMAMPRLPEFYTDGLHPNDFGMTCYAAYVIGKIEEALRG